MLLTSKQHRGIAKLLRQKAEKLPAATKDRATRMRRFADLHMALARAGQQPGAGTEVAE